MNYEVKDERRWKAVDFAEVRIRQGQHQKSPQEYLSGVFIYFMQHGEYELAESLRAHRRCVEGDQDGCRLCRVDPFPAQHAQLKSLSEIQSEVEELEFV